MQSDQLLTLLLDPPCDPFTSSVEEIQAWLSELHAHDVRTDITGSSHESVRRYIAMAEEWLRRSRSGDDAAGMI